MIAKGKAAQTGSANAALLASGRPMVVYGLNAVFSGGGRVMLRNGTGVLSPIVIDTAVDSADTVTRSFGGVGLVFSDGCYIHVTGDITSYSIFYEAL